jgi:acetylglutamate kinase
MKEHLTIIKVGGKVVEEEASLHLLLNDFSKIAGNKLLVHGGGRSATAISEKMGIKSNMVEGRRITDAEMLKVVTMVYGGLVNKGIVAGLQALGTNAVGLTGADMNVIEAVKRPVLDIDYGFVGDVVGVNAGILSKLISEGIVPVMAPITHNGEGQLLNTNADTIASELAVSLSSYFDVRLIYCFEKKGVLTDEADDNSLIGVLSAEKFEELKEKGVIFGGMIPKLFNGFNAMKQGVDSVVITNASALSGGSGGTRLEL